ncbi:hypothetical protein N7524_005313 [Penicillium chrysogenum]|nr:hypothetical protein N7524_005313 [Penicillium chrysogenum]
MSFDPPSSVFDEAKARPGNAAWASFVPFAVPVLVPQQLCQETHMARKYHKYPGGDDGNN